MIPPAASTIAGEVDALYLTLVAITVLFGGGIFLTIFAFAIRYRRRPSHAVAGAVPGSLAIEISWSVLPLLVSIGLFWAGAGTYRKMLRPPPDALEILVTGRQWMWKFQHPDGRGEINELHVPTGRPVRLLLASEDVIHSFFVPAFRVKRDVVPGRWQVAWFEATRPGRYHLFCAEYCGAQHSGMVGHVVVLDPAGYGRWLEGEPRAAGEAASPGEALFAELGCPSCHAPAALRRGPSLVGLFGGAVRLADGRTVTADEAYLRESIVDPAAAVVAGWAPLMPSFRGRVTEEQLLQLVAYLKGLTR